MPPQRIRTRVFKDARSKRWRALAWHPIEERWISASKVLGMNESSFATKTEARRVAYAAAEKLAKINVGGNITVSELRDRWLANGWTKESTAKVNATRTKRFCEDHKDKAIALVEESDWITWKARNDGRPSHLEGLKVMFAWATTAEGGRLLDVSPFRDLKLGKGDGNAEKSPPPIHEIEQMIGHAYNILPSFGAWIEFACFTGLRPGEIDALTWDCLTDDDEVEIRRQWNQATSTFTLPKSGKARHAALPERALRALERAAQISERKPGNFIFVNQQGGHFSTATRGWYWNRLRERMGWTKGEYTLYLCTRHFAGWFMVNMLERPSTEVADQLGHVDHGKLVDKLYGHRDRKRARRRIADAYAAYEAEQRDRQKRRFRAVDGGESA